MIALTPYEEQEVIALIDRVEKKRQAALREGVAVSAYQFEDWLFGVRAILNLLGRADLFDRVMGAQDATHTAATAGDTRGRP
jgi:hypothetical protein